MAEKRQQVQIPAKKNYALLLSEGLCFSASCFATHFDLNPVSLNMNKNRLLKQENF